MANPLIVRAAGRIGNDHEELIVFPHGKTAFLQNRLACRFPSAILMEYPPAG
jgi:hypothetical protein